MKKELIFTLASSILALGISSCGVANSNDTSNESDSSSSILDDTSTSSDTSSSNVSENKAVSTMVNLLEASNNLDASKINGATLSLFKNEWYSVEKDGVTTHKIINYEGQRNTLSFYKNEKAIVETEEVVSGTNGTDSITK